MKKEQETLGTALPKEIERVQEVMAVYLQFSTGHIAASMMKRDISLALKAIMENDTVAMLRVFESLKGWNL